MLRENIGEISISRKGSFVYSFGKRIIDLLAGLIGVAGFLILFPVVGFLIKIDSRGPVLVKLDRVSNGKLIDLYKFRSMQNNAHLLKSSLIGKNERADGPFFKLKNDPRLTKVGKLIRRFRLDEVPQFINVLRGEMSLVGPRPHEPSEIKNYPPEFKFLYKEMGGITGLSQVSGASGLPFKKELELDASYTENKSLWLDFKIISKTVWIMLFDPTAV